jgi:hypothetical protein
MLQKNLKEMATKAGFHYDIVTGTFTVKARCSLLERILCSEPDILDEKLQIFSELIKEYISLEVIKTLNNQIH